MAESTYRLGAAHLLRLAGTLVIGLGVLWIVGDVARYARRRCERCWPWSRSSSWSR